MTRARNRLGLLLVFGMLAALLPVGALAPAAAQTTDVYISEFHYDNDSTDVGEFVEVTGPAGADLTGWSLVLYNGNGGAVYGTIPLSGAIDDEDGTSGALEFDYAGIQNGDPDGMALVDNTGAVVEFLSYGGTFAAVGGAADGLTSIDVGVKEGSTTSAGESLQLIDGTWTGPATASPGALNTSTPPPPPPPPPADVYISEFHYDNDSTDVDEFVEVTGPAGTDLTGWSIVLYNGNGGAPYNTITLLGTIDDEDGTSGALSFAAPGIQNGGPDGIALVDDTGALIEFLSYEGTFTGVGGVADGMTSIDVGVSEPSDSPIGESLQLINGGWVGPRQESPGDLNSAPLPNVYVSEFHYDNDGADVGEFIEVSGDAGGDLTGWSLVLYNGNGGGVYGTIPLSGAIDNENGTEGAVSFTATGLQNGDPDGLALINPLGEVVEFLSYDGSFAATDGPAAGLTSTAVEVSEPGTTPVGQSLQLIDGIWVGPLAASPGDLNSIPVSELSIYDVQGNGSASPYDGQTVIVEGVVTSDQQEGDLNGWFMQDVVGDGDVTTSDGIYVFEGGNTVDVNVGDVVQVKGVVDEYFGMTELTSITSVAVVGTAPVVATTVALPWASLDEPEHYEGMLVTIPQALSISEYYNFGRYGEIVLSAGRQYQPTAVYDPGSPEAAALATANALGRITLDDNRTSQNPDPAIHPNGLEFTLDNYFRGGDLVSNVTGVVNYSFDLYRIQPTQGADYTAANPRTSSPDAVGGSLEVASFNVLNYFTTFGSRGADNEDEFARQRAKIIAAISAIDADIVGLMEIENNTEAVVDLVDGLNEANGAGTYAYVDTGIIGPDEIKVALIYKPSTVSLNGDYAVLDSAEFLDPLSYGEAKNRPALAQTFTEIATGESVTVVVNHLKSKGSACDDGLSGDDDPEAGSCNLTRTMAAQILANWLADPANGFDDQVLIIGDLNSYDKEDPIDTLVGAGYTDLAYSYLGEHAYSYVFDGQLGYLDYGLANEALLPRVTGMTVWHINADEASLIDYDMSFKKPAQDALYAPDPYRASDHDPVVVGLNLVPPDETAPDVAASFIKVAVGYTTGLFKVDYSCTDNADPSPTCTGDINGVSVSDGENVFLIETTRGRPWSYKIGSVLFIHDSEFVLTVTGTDESGNTATATAEPEFRTRRGHRWF